MRRADEEVQDFGRYFTGLLTRVIFSETAETTS